MARLVCKERTRVERLVWKERTRKQGDPKYGRFSTVEELQQLVATDDSAAPPYDIADRDGDSFGVCLVCTVAISIEIDEFCMKSMNSAVKNDGFCIKNGDFNGNAKEPLNVAISSVSSRAPRRTVTLEWGHIFCQGCLEEWLRRENTCPLCRAEIPDTMHFF